MTKIRFDINARTTCRLNEHGEEVLAKFRADAKMRLTRGGAPDSELDHMTRHYAPDGSGEFSASLERVIEIFGETVARGNNPFERNGLEIREATIETQIP